MTEKETYLGYIAFYIENIGMFTPTAVYLDFLRKHLGSKMFDASTDRVQKLAYYLRKTEILAHYTCKNAFYYTLFSDSELDSMLKQIKALFEKNKIAEPSVEVREQPKYMDKYMKRVSISYERVFERFQPKPKKTTPPKKKKTVSKKSKTSPKKVVKKKSTSKTSPKKVVKKREPVSEKCAKYTLVELKERAKKRGLTGYSKMTKADLCRKLKI